MAVKYTIPFKDMANQQWRIDVLDSLSSSADPVFNYEVDRPGIPSVNATLLIQDGYLTVADQETAGSGNCNVVQGHTYTITAKNPTASAAANPRLRLTITENSIVIFDQSVVATLGATIVKTGVAIPGYIYSITVTGESSADVVTPINDPSDPAGKPIPVRGNGHAGVIAWQPDNTDDQFACYKSSTITVNVIQQGQINIDELQEAQDRDFTIRVYKGDNLYWQGFLIPDGIQYTEKSGNFPFSFTAICGLTMLENLPYVHTDLQGTTIAISRCPMNYIRNVLFNILGNILPIRWSNYLTCTAFDLEDVFTGSVQWGADGTAFLSYQSGENGDLPGPPQTCDYILKGILQSMQCTICLDNGRWNIRRIPDLIRFSVPYKQISGDTGMMVINSGNEGMLKQIGRYGNYPRINEDQVRTVKQGVKSCTVTYNANIRDNILPNGSLDYRYLLNLLQTTRYWAYYDSTDPYVVSTVGSLDGRDGYAADLIFEGTGTDPQYFTMFASTDIPLGKNGLPIDVNTMIKYIIFGFMFEAGTGWPTTTGGVIDWTNEPLRIKVILNLGGIQYWLNKFGFWVQTDTYIPIVVDNLSPTDVARVDFNAFQNVITPTTPGPIIAGYESDIQVLFRVAPGLDYKLDNIYINIDKGNDVYSSTFNGSRNTTNDTRSLNISSSFGGYMLSNFMTSPFNSDVECFYRDGDVYTGTLTGLTANAIMRCRYKSSKIFNGSINVRNQPWNFDCLYNIDGLGGAFFLPLGASYDIEAAQVNNLVAIEIRNDNVIFTESYYNSNDQQLSN